MFRTELGTEGLAGYALEKCLANSMRLRDGLRDIEIRRERECPMWPAPIAAGLDECIDLLEPLARSGAARRVVGVAGFPGAGKTTLTAAIIEGINSRLGGSRSAHVPMDGFHFTNARLQELDLVDIKGDITTFDCRAFGETLSRLVKDAHETQRVPSYDRGAHDVIDGSITVLSDVRLIVTEGIYVGLSEGAWDRIGSRLDRLIYLDVAPRTCLERVVHRNRSSAHTLEFLERKLNNDLRFMGRTLSIARKADLIVRM